MTTTPARGRASSTSTGSTRPARSSGTRRRRSSTRTRSKRGDGQLARGRPARRRHRHVTGRSPKDKFVVAEPGSEDRIWWGEVNQPLAEDRFDGLRAKVVAHLERAGPALRRRRLRRRRPGHRLGVRVSPPARATRSSRRRSSSTPTAEELARRSRGVVLHAPRSRPTRRRTAPASGTFVVLHPTHGRGPRSAERSTRRDQEVDLHGDELPAAARGRPADALLGERRRGRQASRSSSGSPAPARRRSRPTRSAR